MLMVEAWVPPLFLYGLLRNLIRIKDFVGYPFVEEHI